MLRIFSYLFSVLLLALICGAAVVAAFVWHLNRDLPDYSHLANYQPPVMTRVYAADGELLAEYASERRLYVPANAIPQRVINAFLSAEDKNFYSHSGIDVMGIMRAMFDNVENLLSGHRLAGASTITQQVAKNFLLTNSRTFERKLKEALLALKIERAYSKRKILELYLNEIYLGQGAYGVAAASENYFGKPLDQLTVAECAYLASLPKAPNNYNPFRFKDRATARRNWVISRMQSDGYISSEEAAAATAENLAVIAPQNNVKSVDAEYFVEEVRRELSDRYGDKVLYEGGLSVRTTLDTRLQAEARKALRRGLVEYDFKRGFRGAVAQLPAGTDWRKALADMPLAPDLAPWTLAVVLDVTPERAMVGLRPQVQPDGTYTTTGAMAEIPVSELKWARRTLPNGGMGPAVKAADQILAVGDVIYVAPVYAQAATPAGEAPDHYALRQLPAVNGAIVSIDPQTGRVVAMVGGFSYQESEFNRAVQAQRQPGSSFKPFVYSAALDRGYTPASLILDAPITFTGGPGQDAWSPENYSKRFYGPSTLRLGVEQSRNVMTVRLAQSIGMPIIVDYAKRFDINDHLMPVLAMALGAGETTVLKMTNAYAMLDNGGRKLTPSLIDRVQDRWGKTIYKHDARDCPGCGDDWNGQAPPNIPYTGEQVISPQTAYQMTSILEGVVERGTASAVKAVGVPVAGKTGTTNDYKDAWFLGYTPNLVAGVFVGFDNPTSLGKGETGGHLAAPIFRDFMIAAIGDKPAIPFRIPPGIELVKINAKTGALAQAGDPGTILEAFKQGTGPQWGDSPWARRLPGQPGGADDGSGNSGNGGGDGDISTGTGGLY
ncbi:MAG: penicillin-binding protein 1A [Parvibaculaceae bacterium]|nr:penicillin-binding protein 1A [Parvibaculaceae bacterium]